MNETIERNAENAAKINAAADFEKLATMNADERAAAAKSAEASKIADMILEKLENAADERAAEKRAADERAAIAAKLEKYAAAAAAENDEDMKTALNAAADKQRAILADFDNAAAAKNAADERAAIAAAIRAVFGFAADDERAAEKTEKRAAKTEKRAAADNKYTYIDAVCEAVTDEWQTAGPIGKNAEKIGKLAQIKTNDRWTGAFANALKDAADDGLIERRSNGKYNEYRRLQNAAD